MMRRKIFFYKKVHVGKIVSTFSNGFFRPIPPIDFKEGFDKDAKKQSKPHASRKRKTSGGWLGVRIAKGAGHRIALMTFTVMGGSLIATLSNKVLEITGGYTATFAMLLALTFAALIPNLFIRKP